MNKIIDIVNLINKADKVINCIESLTDIKDQRITSLLKDLKKDKQELLNTNINNIVKYESMFVIIQHHLKNAEILEIN